MSPNLPADEVYAELKKLLRVPGGFINGLEAVGGIRCETVEMALG